MSLTAADVAEIMRLVEQSVFDELTLEFDGIKLSLRRGAAPSSISTSASSEVSAGAPKTAPAPRETPKSPALDSLPDPNVRDVVAPMLGTFYRAPRPGAPSFVELGSVVEEDTIIGIIEVMKLMNSVCAGVRGTVTEIIAPDGSLVEYGQAMLRVREGAR